MVKQIATKNEKRVILDIFWRYLAAILSSLGDSWIFYFIFTPLTIYPSFIIVKLFQDASLAGDTILIGSSAIQIIEACVAGSAYYLLFILNMTTSGIRLKERAKIVFFTLSMLLAFNILRIVFFSFMKINGFPFFEELHLFFWYFVSVFYVLILWLITIKIFRIKSIPCYSDFITLKKMAKR
jgi:exosortase/archaeosortase family protein